MGLAREENKELYFKYQKGKTLSQRYIWEEELNKEKCTQMPSSSSLEYFKSTPLVELDRSQYIANSKLMSRHCQHIWRTSLLLMFPQNNTTSSIWETH